MKKVLLSLLIMLVLSEVLLRLFGAVYLATSGRDAGAEGSGAILCVGDSTTFGLYLSAEESYPARLDGLVARHGTAVPVRNLGIPGMSAGHVARELEGHLDRHEPRVVILLCGLNNSWSGDEARTSAWGRFVDDLRVVRVVRLLAASLLASEEERQAGGGDTGDPGTDPATGVLPADSGAELPDSDGVVDLVEHRSRAVRTEEGQLFRMRNREGEEVVFLQQNKRLEGGEFLDVVRGCYEGMVATCRERGVDLVLLTYPFESPLVSSVNDVLRDVAESHDLLLVDLERELGPRVATDGVDAYAFPDLHPRSSGAEWIAAIVQRALVEEGLVDGVQAPLPGAPAAPQTRPRTLELRGDRFFATGPRGEAVRIVLARAPGRTQFGGVEVPLAADDLLALFRDGDPMVAGIGPDGTAEIVLPPKIRARLGGEPVQAVAVFGNQNRRNDVMEVVGPIPVDPGSRPPEGTPGGRSDGQLGGD